MPSKAIQDYTAEGKRQVLIEYILIKDLTDSLEAADEVATYLQGLPVRVNLIPYNPQQPTHLERSASAVISAFKKRLQSYGLPTLLRTTKGDQLMAACGQLATP